MNYNEQKNPIGFMGNLTPYYGVREMGEHAYNLIIGAALAWGFFLCYLLLGYMRQNLMMFLYRADADTLKGLSIGVLIGYFVFALGGSALVRTRNLGLCIIGYHMVVLSMGFLLAIAAALYEPALVTRAALLTGIVALSMMVVSSIFPMAFASMGSGLGIALLTSLIVELVATFLFHVRTDFMDWVVLVIMSLYVGFDWVRANSIQRTATNAIGAATALFVDVANIFIRILSILARSKRRD
ncbi:MAG: Bax inhibitor-1 family protein [Clostridia bacterium]|nr:Bax inhibitor-1 family protein [Clostridia bacterium]